MTILKPVITECKAEICPMRDGGEPHPSFSLIRALGMVLATFAFGLAIAATWGLPVCLLCGLAVLWGTALGEIWH